MKRLSAMPGYQPIFIKYDITPDELAFIESHRNEFPELDTITVHRRLYPKNGFMAHLIGYVGEVSEDMLNNPRYELYNSGDVVGQSGVEAEYNDMLMGKNGSRRVLVNSKGKEVGELSDTPAVPGKSLQLTIDLDLQIAAEEALGDKPGAIVAMDPKTGEILAMVSRPTFDPERICRAHHFEGMERAADRSRQATAEQGDPGAAGAGFGVQDHHERGGLAGGHCADAAGKLRRRRVVLWPLLQVLAKGRARFGDSDQGRSISPATCSSTPSPNDWASSASQNMQRLWDWGRRRGSIFRRKSAA